MQKLLTALLTITVLASCSRPATTNLSESIRTTTFYKVTPSTKDYNSFYVEITPPTLSAKENIYQFAATAPGTYSVMDIGRFASEFKAFDASNNSIPVTQRNTNQFILSTPERVHRITYTIKETWDTPVAKNKIYYMCGSSLEADHLLFNAHTVLGYFSGHQDTPIELAIEALPQWTSGTALSLNANGHYNADNYDHLVDSPILMGRLSKATTLVGDVPIEIYTYSRTDLIKSEQILASMEDMLQAAGSFLEELPIDRYTFLFHFEHSSQGAWEHSYSSEYVYKENPWEYIEDDILATASHEFFHIVTPLNIHSEIISQFNFVEPTPSAHLWLYEGVTEWASDMILLHGDLISLEDYLDQLQFKLNRDERYESSFSILDMAMTSYTPEGKKQYGNIYMRGSVVAGLIDLLIIQKSQGEQTLRELIIELANHYGPHRPFSEATFFDEFAERSHPDIRHFIANHIEDTQSLPLENLFGLIGIEYQESLIDSSSSGLGLNYFAIAEGFYLLSYPNNTYLTGLKPGDIITKINGLDVNTLTKSSVEDAIEAIIPGSPLYISYIRKGNIRSLEGKTIIKNERHVFRIDTDAGEDALRYRAIWSGDL